MDGAVKFNVSANTAQFDSAMGRVGNSAKTAGDKVRAAFSGLGGMLAGGAIIAGMSNILRKMDDISDRARRLGMSAVEIQKIGNAAELVGTNVETVARAMNRAGVAANKAAREGGALAEAFARVNIDPAKFAAADLEERIKMVAKAQQAASGDAQKMANLFEAIGVKAAGIDFTALAEEMGNVSAASNETVEALARANDELDKAKQNATIFGANLLKGISDAAEIFGNAFGGGVSQTNEQLDAKIERDNAIGMLRTEGKLLPSDTTTVTRGVANPTARDFREGLAWQEQVKGQNDLANDKMIEERIASQRELNRAKEEEARLAKASADAEREQTSTAENRAKAESEALKFKQYMLDIDLKIKEAQAAGDQDRADSLQKIKDWTEAAIKYEGDLDMAARDVNASLKERLRLKDQEIAKQQQSIEAELKHIETMAFGTDEAKAKAEWMDEYNRRISEGATDEQAKRFANAATFKPQEEMSYGGGGGGGSGGGGLGPAVSGAPMSENMRVAQLRGAARQATRDQRASELASRGMFRSAIRAQDAGQRAYDRAMQSAADRDMAGQYDFAGRPAGNMGEAMSGIADKIGKMEALDRMRNAEGYDPTKGETENMANAMRQGAFNDMAKEQSMTPEERKAMESKPADSGGGGGGGSDKAADPIQGTLDLIVSLMQERLPIRVLAS